MTEAYHWHCHPDSDESFLVLEGGLFIDFDDRTVELLPGQIITVNRGVRHRTRPVGKRSVNLTFERAGARSEGPYLARCLNIMSSSEATVDLCLATYGSLAPDGSSLQVGWTAGQLAAGHGQGEVGVFCWWC